jgi:hypothetical protein
MGVICLPIGTGLVFGKDIQDIACIGASNTTFSPFECMIWSSGQAGQLNRIAYEVIIGDLTLATKDFPKVGIDRMAEE